MTDQAHATPAGGRHPMLCPATSKSVIGTPGHPLCWCKHPPVHPGTAGAPMHECPCGALWREHDLAADEVPQEPESSPPYAEPLTAIDLLDGAAADKEKIEAVERSTGRRTYERVLSALDRCEHGRHKADHCVSCPGGRSSGNLFLPPGQRIGTDLYGQPIVAPAHDQRSHSENWVQAGRVK